MPVCHWHRRTLITSPHMIELLMKSRALRFTSLITAAFYLLTFTSSEAGVSLQTESGVCSRSHLTPKYQEVLIQSNFYGKSETDGVGTAVEGRSFKDNLLMKWRVCARAATVLISGEHQNSKISLAMIFFLIHLAFDLIVIDLFVKAIWITSFAFTFEFEGGGGLGIALQTFLWLLMQSIPVGGMSRLCLSGLTFVGFFLVGSFLRGLGQKWEGAKKWSSILLSARLSSIVIFAHFIPAWIGTFAPLLYFSSKDLLLFGDLIRVMFGAIDLQSRAFQNTEQLFLLARKVVSPDFNKNNYSFTVLGSKWTKKKMEKALGLKSFPSNIKNSFIVKRVMLFFLRPEVSRGKIRKRFFSDKNSRQKAVLFIGDEDELKSIRKRVGAFDQYDGIEERIFQLDLTALKKEGNGNEYGRFLTPMLLEAKEVARPGDVVGAKIPQENLSHAELELTCFHAA